MADALDYGVKVTGCTVHVATEEVDAGPILAQAAVVVEPDDTVESLHERIKVVERDALRADRPRHRGPRLGVSAPVRSPCPPLAPSTTMRALHRRRQAGSLARHGLAGWDLLSSGGTAAALAEAGIPVTDVADLTGVAAPCSGTGW